MWNPLGYTVVNDSYKSEHATELAGKSLPTSGTTPEQLASDLALVHRMAADAGRDLSGLEVVVSPTKLSIRPDRIRQYAEAGATGFVYNAAGQHARGVHREHRRVRGRSHRHTLKTLTPTARSSVGS